MKPINPEILAEYRKEDEFVLINEHDPDLATIKIKLPSLCDWYAQFLGYTPTWEEAITYVEGYGIPAEHQVWTYQAIPDKIKHINATIRKKRKMDRGQTVTLTDIYYEIEDNRTHYKDEIEWVQRDIKRRYHGYWVFINGKPTYIDGWHYVYLNYWDIASSRPDGLPEYRDIDRRLFHFARYCYTTTEAFFQYKVSWRELGIVKNEYFGTLAQAEKFHDAMREKGHECMLDGVPTEDGQAHNGFIVDMSRRICYGFAHPKRRRRGATSAAACVLYLIVTERRLRWGGIQSLNDDMATKDVFKDKLIRPWRKLPFWHKPMHDGSNNPASKLNLQPPADRTNLSAGIEKDGHDGWIEPRAANERAFDGTKLYALIRDEGGKIDGYVYDLMEWWGIQKKCLAQGPIIHGLGMIPSTVGEMDSGGGRQYERLIMQSKWENRDANGETATGLFTIMEAAFDGLDGFIDVYGNSVIDDPKSPVLGIDGRWITKGAKTYLMAKREMLQRDGSPEDYIAELRDFPFTLREAMTKGGRNNGIDRKILNKRINAIRFSRQPDNFIKPRRGNFEWYSDFGGEVVWRDDPDGKFLVSQFPSAEQRNRRVFDADEQHYLPDPLCCNRFVVGADPFMFDAKDTSGQKKSNGAISVFKHRDTVNDPDTKPKSEWSSNKFVLTYSVRSEDKNEYVEDCLKVCLFYSSYIYPEMNVATVSELFRKWGFAGFLLHDTNEYGVKVPMCGRKVSANGETKNEIFADVMTHVRNFAEWENHIELLEEWMNIDGPADMTNHDLFAAAGMCFLGRKSQFPTMMFESTNLMQIDELPFDSFEV